MINPGVYILISEKNSRYYIGSTDDVERRVKEHNTGEVFSTRNKGPWKLKVFVQCENIKNARSSEYRLKKYKRKDILEKVIEDKIFPWNYRKRP